MYGVSSLPEQSTAYLCIQAWRSTFVKIAYHISTSPIQRERKRPSSHSLTTLKSYISYCITWYALGTLWIIALYSMDGHNRPSANIFTQNMLIQAWAASTKAWPITFTYGRSNKNNNTKKSPKKKVKSAIVALVEVDVCESPRSHHDATCMPFRSLPLPCAPGSELLCPLLHLHRVTDFIIL